MRSGPRFLYLHGFASGPGSKKGVALAAHYALQGVDLQRLNLRVPSLAQLRFSTMLQVVRDAIGDPLDRAERAVLFGSSLGGLVAAHVAAAVGASAAAVVTQQSVGTWYDTGSNRDYTPSRLADSFNSSFASAISSSSTPPGSSSGGGYSGGSSGGGGGGGSSGGGGGGGGGGGW